MAGWNASSLWMGDIDQYMDERVITEAFSMMGEHVVAVKLLEHKPGQNRNYCFVQLTSKEAVNLAIRRLTGLPLPNYPTKTFRLNYSSRDSNQSQTQAQADTGASPSPYGKEYSIYVGGLIFCTSDEELLALFAHYKSVKDAKIVCDETQKSKGYGFVRFYKKLDQEAAILQMNGAVGPMGVTLKVDRGVDRAVEKAMPKRELNAQAAAGGLNTGHLPTGAAIEAMPGQYPQANPYQPGQQLQQQQQPYQAPAAEASQQPPQPAKQQDDDETLEDHSAPVNMVATNLAFIQANQDFYKNLADSRWHPITTYNTTISEICQ